MLCGTAHYPTSMAIPDFLLIHDYGAQNLYPEFSVGYALSHVTIVNPPALHADRGIRASGLGYTTLYPPQKVRGSDNVQSGYEFS